MSRKYKEVYPGDRPLASLPQGFDIRKYRELTRADFKSVELFLQYKVDMAESRVGLAREALQRYAAKKEARRASIEARRQQVQARLERLSQMKESL